MFDNAATAANNALFAELSTIPVPSNFDNYEVIIFFILPLTLM